MIEYKLYDKIVGEIIESNSIEVLLDIIETRLDDYIKEYNDVSFCQQGKEYYITTTGKKKGIDYLY